MFTSDWKDIAKQAHELAKEKGFYDQPVSLEKHLILFMTEIVEWSDAFGYSIGNTIPLLGKIAIEAWKEEVADIALRMVDMLAYHEYKFDRKVWPISTSGERLVREYDAARREHRDFDLDVVFGMVLGLEQAEPELRTWMFLKHTYNKTRPRLHGKAF